METTTPSHELPPAQVELTQEANSITELFSKEPDSWTDKDMEDMIVHLRKMRGTFEAEKAKPKKSSTPKIAKEDLQAASGEDLLAKLGL